MCSGFDSHFLYTQTFSSGSVLAKDYPLWQFEHSQDSALSQESKEEQKGSFSFCYFLMEKETVCQGTWIVFQGCRNWRDCCFWADDCLLKVHTLLKVRCGWMSLGRRVNTWQNWLGQATVHIMFYIPFIMPETWRNKMFNVFHVPS